MFTFQYVCQKHFEILICSPKFCRPHISCTDQRDWILVPDPPHRASGNLCPVLSLTRDIPVFKFKSFSVMCNDIKYYMYTCMRAMQGENINCNINSFHYIQT